ncbi:MAG: 2-oxoglutarate dehydrogenase complex dihydrolipoyllysine-residue succinyltransferase [Bacteroidia bacterium]|nr:2-oxoglutarate dehydrogenase complex dihydrolipoyllysine-residue succinyltransferase [Bacteroidia bacterium]
MIDLKVPSPGESITEVTIATWFVKDGDIVKKDQELAEIESDKAMLVLYAEAAGQIAIKAPAGQTVAVGAVAAVIDETKAGAAPAPVAKEHPVVEKITVAEPAAQGNDSYAKGLPSPSAQKLINESGITPSTIAGSGKDGRITKGDVQEALKQPAATPQPAANGAPTAPATPPPAVVYGGERTASRERMTRLRQTIATRLVSVKNETAMLTTFNEVDMTNILAIRKQYKEAFEKRHGIGLGFMGFFVKACCEALKFFPHVGAQIDGDELISYTYVDMGIAVSTERGLMVPVVRDAHAKPLYQIERDIAALATKARDGKISLDDLQGGTFSITNGGVFGSLMSTPILNPPQSAILGMHKTQERPVALNGQVVIRPMMYVALSYDHRVIDGKDSVSFLVKVKDFLEDPVRLLLEM